MQQKIIWSLWVQGWDNAPDLVKACKASWRLHNPEWTIHFLCERTLRDYVRPSPEFNELYNKKHPIVVLSDVIRNELLTTHGGIWADGTTYCLLPLVQWIDYAVASGFFAFNRPGPDRILSNWFLAAERNNYVPRVWLKKPTAFGIIARREINIIGIISFC